MNFRITVAQTVEEAVAASGEYRAGGTDVQARRRSGLSSGPLVDIRRLPGYESVIWSHEGTATIGALVTLHRVATDEAIVRHYPGLAQAAATLATPQIRHAATLGGSLLQRTRCWYYRHPQIDCYKSGVSRCPAREGHNPNGVVFDQGPCVYPHPSTIGMALLAYEAHFTTHGRPPRPVATLYGDGTDPTRDHLLDSDELLTAVHLPPPTVGEKAAYFRATARAEAEWPIVECLVRLTLDAGKITLARVAVGGVANTPVRLRPVEAALEGLPADPAILEQAAAHAAEDANPLPQTRYKVTFLVNTVLETLERATAA